MAKGSSSGGSGKARTADASVISRPKPSGSKVGDASSLNRPMPSGIRTIGSGGGASSQSAVPKGQSAVPKGSRINLKNFPRGK